jgi:hypothetical protein
MGARRSPSACTSITPLWFWTRSSSKARNTNHKLGVGWSPLALQPEFRPKPQSTPTRLLAREAAELRQTEFESVGSVFCLAEVSL